MIIDNNFLKIHQLYDLLTVEFNIDFLKNKDLSDKIIICLFYYYLLKLLFAYFHMYNYFLSIIYSYLIRK